VHKAFEIIDDDGNGFVEPSDIVDKYSADKHPDVISGDKTPEEVMREFLDTFDVGGEKDGKVTRNEFENYYKNISSSIDNDDYFELMMRNAWHISGGEGWAANSSNKRVLVTDRNGKQYVAEIENDLGLDLIPVEKRKDEMMKRLRKQGLDVANIDTGGSCDDETPEEKSGNPNFAKSNVFG